jgi:signal peptidase I
MKADARKQQAAPKQKEPMGQTVRREALAWFWVILVFMLINGTIGQARVIPSESMKNTLLVGDHLIMSRIGYDAGVPFTDIHHSLWRNPKRQQIVIFRSAVPGDKSDIIKRVIGLPGESLDIRDGGVWINGVRLREDYTVGRTEPGEPMMFRGALEGRTTSIVFSSWATIAAILSIAVLSAAFPAPTLSARPS